MLIRSITQNAMDKKFSIRQFPSPEHPYIAFPQKNLAVLDISRFTTGEIGPQSRLYVIYNVIVSIAKPLVHIFNLSLSCGVFPDHMKIAKIIPIFKNGQKTEFTNYRPISILSQFSKILEKLFNLRLDKNSRCK